MGLEGGCGATACPPLPGAADTQSTRVGKNRVGDKSAWIPLRPAPPQDRCDNICIPTGSWWRRPPTHKQVWKSPPTHLAAGLPGSCAAPGAGPRAPRPRRGSAAEDAPPAAAVATRRHAERAARGPQHASGLQHAGRLTPRWAARSMVGGLLDIVEPSGWRAAY